MLLRNISLAHSFLQKNKDLGFLEQTTVSKNDTVRATVKCLTSKKQSRGPLILRCLSNRGVH